jgi:hypothetical protein
MRMEWIKTTIVFLLYLCSCNQAADTDKQDGSVVGKKGDDSGTGRSIGNSNLNSLDGEQIEKSETGVADGTMGKTDTGVADSGKSEMDTGVVDSTASEIDSNLVDSSSASATALCVGDEPRMILNGIESRPTVRGSLFRPDCCDGAMISVSTDSFSHILVINWTALVGVLRSSPISIDLAYPPQEWGVWVYTDCYPNSDICNPSAASVSTRAGNNTLQGTLSVSRSDTGLYDVTLCLTFPAETSLFLIRSLQLYAPHVLVDY